ncbi:MAG: hypothetical protein U0V75_12340 [Ferruginibacter sp.]
MKRFLPAILLLLATVSRAQQVDSIYVNLYTDSLKKGTYNYINVDGLLHNGRYLPLDSSHISFTASAGNFFGNSLLLDRDFAGDRVQIKVVLKKNPALHKEFTMYIKIKPDNENLKTVEELYGLPAPKPKKKRG